jgi:DNA-binding PadR family transcriptional regulator
VAELRESSYLALVALAGEPRHGYGIIQEVRRLSGGRTELRAGTLYGLLDRLEAEHAVQVDREEVVDGRLRRYYRLTQDGASLLAEESRRRASTSKEALRRLRLAGGLA